MASTNKKILDQSKYKNFKKVNGEVFNLGLSSANITKLQLAKKVKKVNKKTQIKVIYWIKDPDKRDYFVSNQKIEKKGFKAKNSLEDGIREAYECLKLNCNFEDLT